MKFDVRAYYGGKSPDTVEDAMRSILGALRAHYWLYQTAHWQSQGTGSYGDHLLFQRLYEAVQDEVDGIAEKLVGYFGSDAVDPVLILEITEANVQSWSQESSLYARGLRSEKEYQQLLRVAYEMIKRDATMPLGLDDWIMASSSTHDTHIFLLQQRMRSAAVETGAKTGSRYVPSRSLHQAWQRLVEKGRSKWRTWDDWAAAAEALVLASDEIQRDSYGDPDDIAVDDLVAGLLMETEGVPRRRLAAVETGPAAPDASGHFFDNPEQREVRELADSKAVTNSPEVAEVAEVGVDGTAREVRQQVQKAKKAPPTPEDILEEPGAKEYSTLNRFVVDTADVVPGLPEGHEQLPKHPDTLSKTAENLVVRAYWRT